MSCKKPTYFLFILSLISVTHSWGILQFNLKKSLLDLKELGPPYWARINLVYIYKSKFDNSLSQFNFKGLQFLFTSRTLLLQFFIALKNSW